MENTESIYQKAANQFYLSCDRNIQKLLDETKFKINTKFSIIELWTNSAKVAERLGKKRNTLNHKMWGVFPQHWQLRIVLDRCYGGENITLWSSEDLDYLVAGHEKEPSFNRS
jgi:hypothetical protein